MNNNLVLICGKSSTGKSMSLKDLKNPQGVMYLNCENNKKLPFNSDFMRCPATGEVGFNITDPLEVYECFNAAETCPDVHTIVIDSATCLMDMFETVYVATAGEKKSRQMWGQYAQYWKRLMSQYVAKSTKNVIITAHTRDLLNESEMVMETLVKVKGSLMDNGIESYFSTIIAAKRVPLSKLSNTNNDLLMITPRDKALGYKHVFQTIPTEDSVNERMRGSFGLWAEDYSGDKDAVNETFIDNNAQLVLDRLHQYYD